MKRIILPMVAALALVGCGSLGGGGEDFTVTVKRPVAAVFTPFSDVQIQSEARTIFPTLKLTRTRPSDNEVLYTFPVEGKEPATIRLTFEAIDGGKATVIHAAVDVPTLVVNIGGQKKFLNEFLVEKGLRALIVASTTGLEAGSSGSDASKSFAALITALAIATDKQAMARAQELIKDPARADLAMAALGGGEYFGNYDAERDAETVDRPRGSGDEVMEDPNDRLNEEAWQRERAEERADRALESNAAANDDTAGASTEQ
jgi:hypothetical protein